MKALPLAWQQPVDGGALWAAEVWRTSLIQSAAGDGRRSQRSRLPTAVFLGSPAAPADSLPVVGGTLAAATGDGDVLVSLRVPEGIAVQIHPEVCV